MALQSARMNTFYERLADWVIANPGVKLSVAAGVFNRSPTWLSKITNSPVFRAILAERQKNVTKTIEEKLASVTLLGLTRLEAALADTSVPLPMAEVRETTDMVLNRLGYGKPQAAAPAATTNIQNNTIVVCSADLAAARQTMAKLASGT